MSMDLTKLKELHDKAFEHGQTNRRDGAHDMVFKLVVGGQWENFIEECPLAFKGEFDTLGKAVKDAIEGQEANPIQIDFSPRDEDRKDAGETADKIYRADDNHNTSLFAYENARQETVICGTGAWELRHEYESNFTDDKAQVIRRYPIYEANNNVYWDPNAKMIDKSDAKYVSVLKPYSSEGYKDLVKELTGEDIDSYDGHKKLSAADFAYPEHSYQFPWSYGGESEKIYVVDFYYREKSKETILTMVNPFGQEMILRESELEHVLDDMDQLGYKVVDEKKVESWKVTKYIASGAAILDESVIACDHIPIIPYYGEYAYVEGEPVTRGLVRCAKDPAMLRNLLYSYLADLAARAPRAKDIYLEEQIAGQEKYFDINGPDDNYPYAKQNRLAEDGSPLPGGPVGKTTSAEIPPAVAALLPLATEAISDVADPGVPQDIADPDVSGKAIHALTAKLDKQTAFFQRHFKYAKRRDAEIYISMASRIYDVPRKVKGMAPDGTEKEIEIMEAVIDEDSGDIVYLNDLRNVAFDVRSEIGKSYTSQKEQTSSEIGEMLLAMPPDDPMRRALMLKRLELIDGVNFDDIRKHARKQLILDGITEPDTDEEKALLEQQAEQAQQPDAATLVGQAELLKGQSDMMDSEQAGIKMQLDDANTKAKLRIEEQKLINERMRLQIEAQKAGATIDKAGAETTGVQLDNLLKEKEIVLPDFAAMSDDELFGMAMPEVGV